MHCKYIFFFLFFVNKRAKKEEIMPCIKTYLSPFPPLCYSSPNWCYCFIHCPSSNLFCRLIFFFSLHGKRSKDKSCFFFNWVKPLLIKSTDTWRCALFSDDPFLKCSVDTNGCCSSCSLTSKRRRAVRIESEEPEGLWNMSHQGLNKTNDAFVF